MVAYFGWKPIFSGSKTTGHLLNYLVTICSLENKQLNNFPENSFFLFKWIIKVEWRDNLTIFRNFFSGHHVQCILFSLLCSKFSPDGFHHEIISLIKSNKNSCVKFENFGLGEMLAVSLVRKHILRNYILPQPNQQPETT